MAVSYDIVVGLDVGKGAHHAVALDRAGAQVLSQRLTNDEAILRRLLEALQQHGSVLVVVDQPATVGALPVAVAREVGVAVAYLPGLIMRRMADTLPGEAKTDARDALVIATTARSAAHTLRALEVTDEDLASLTMLVGFDADLLQQQTATKNRLRGLLTHIHPALDGVLGPELNRHGVLAVLEQWPTPPDLVMAGERRIARFLTRQGSRKGPLLAAEIVQALARQTVIVAGTAAAAQIIPRLAQQLRVLNQQRDELAIEVERFVDAHPLASVLMSMPGVGVRTTATLLTTLAGKSFASAAPLAASAGIAPVTRRSGSSIRGDDASRRGNTALQQALSQSAFASLLHHPESRAYYDRKKAEGKRHNQALIALARRRIDVLYAMIRDQIPYQSPTTQTT